MIIINVRLIALSILFVAAVVLAWPAWLQLIIWLVEFPIVRGGLVGFVIGVAIRANWAWNAALALRRQQAVDKAEREYAQDRRRVV